MANIISNLPVGSNPDSAPRLDADMVLDAMQHLMLSPQSPFMVTLPPSIVDSIVRSEPPEFSASELTTIGRASVTVDEMPEPTPMADEEVEAAVPAEEKYLSMEYYHNICKVNGAFSFIVHLKDVYALFDLLEIPYAPVARCPFCGQIIRTIIAMPDDLGIRQRQSAGEERKSFRRYGRIRLYIVCSSCRSASNGITVSANQIEEITSAIPMDISRLSPKIISNYVSYIPLKGEEVDTLIDAFEGLCTFNSGLVKIKSELVRLVASEYTSITSRWNTRIDCKEIERQETEEELKVARKKLREESKGIIKRPMSSD